MVNGLIGINNESLEIIIKKNVLLFMQHLIPELNQIEKTKANKIRHSAQQLIALKNITNHRKALLKKVPKKKAEFYFGLNFIYIILFSGLAFLLFRFLCFDLIIHKNVINYTRNFLPVPERMQTNFRKILTLITNQLLDEPIYNLSDTPASLAAEIANTDFNLSFEPDAFGYSDSIMEFDLKNLNYDLCQLFFLQEFVQILDLCLSLFPDIKYNGGIPISVQKNISATTGPNSQLEIQFPDPSVLENEGKYFISIATLATISKRLMGSAIIKLESGMFTQRPINPVFINDFFMDALRIFNYNYYMQDFFHHIIVG